MSNKRTIIPLPNVDKFQCYKVINENLEYLMFKEDDTYKFISLAIVNYPQNIFDLGKTTDAINYLCTPVTLDSNGIRIASAQHPVIVEYAEDYNCSAYLILECMQAIGQLRGVK